MKFNVALSGGNTPKLFFSVLADKYKDKIQWSRVNFYWVDERCVSPEDSESNFGMTKKILFDKIEIPPENINRIAGENDPYEEAKRYSELLKENVPSKNGFPEFDIIILGIGEDGHTASIFPDQMELMISDKICQVAVHPTTLQKRITLTGKVLNNGKKISFMVTGKEKSRLVKTILEKKDGIIKYPAAQIKPIHGELRWYLDSQAASKLDLN